MNSEQQYREWYAVERTYDKVLLRHQTRRLLLRLRLRLILQLNDLKATYPKKAVVFRSKVIDRRVKSKGCLDYIGLKCDYKGSHVLLSCMAGTKAGKTVDSGHAICYSMKGKLDVVIAWLALERTEEWCLAEFERLIFSLFKDPDRRFW